MFDGEISRRRFLKNGLLSLSSLAFLPSLNKLEEKEIFNPKYLLVGNKSGVSIYKNPDDKSVIMYQRNFNDIINAYYSVSSKEGPDFNPLWYRVWGGYVHSGNVTEVKYQTNPLSEIHKETGQLTEVTVPFTRSFFYSRFDGWKEMYRLYFGSLHWVLDIIEGPDKKPWYKIKDELIKVELAVKPAHLRFVEDQEFSPLSPDVPVGDKVIEVHLATQTLRAFEGNQVVFESKISSGIPNSITQTPKGTYNIMTKMPSKHMGDGKLTGDIYAYELMGVPWNCFFQMEDGIATHGTYWHSNFGSPMSRGCINMRINEAKWIYRWTTPIASPENWEKHGYGTKVMII